MGEFEDCSTEQGNPTECGHLGSESEEKEEIENTNRKGIAGEIVLRMFRNIQPK
ncbi:hypothetical protein FACS1894188_07270 [Clostridia bacterium]|nr:hypothetical protein FACS1894188_07270 [Clostridia bacterium]